MLLQALDQINADEIHIEIDKYNDTGHLKIDPVADLAEGEPDRDPWHEQTRVEPTPESFQAGAIIV